MTRCDCFLRLRDRPKHSNFTVFLTALRVFSPEQVVQLPVTTLDLAATFIVLAGGTVPSGMNSTSLLPLLREPTAPPPRTVVHSGLMNFRVVIKIFNESSASCHLLVAARCI